MNISLELAQRIINYLQTRPFIEVHELIRDLLNASQTETVPPADNES